MHIGSVGDGFHPSDPRPRWHSIKVASYKGSILHTHGGRFSQISPVKLTSSFSPQVFAVVFFLPLAFCCGHPFSCVLMGFPQTLFSLPVNNNTKTFNIKQQQQKEYNNYNFKYNTNNFKLILKMSPGS